MESFLAHSWDTDERWHKYLASVEITDSLGLTRARLEMLKARYYRREVDPSFSLEQPAPAASTAPQDAPTGANPGATPSSFPNQYAVPGWGARLQQWVFSLILPRLWLYAHIYLLVSFTFLIVDTWRWYYRIWWSALVAYAASLLGAIGVPRWDYRTLERVITNDNTHYMFMCMLFLTAPPTMMALLPIVTYSALQLIRHMVAYLPPYLPPWALRPIFLNTVSPALQWILARSPQLEYAAAYVEATVLVLLLMGVLSQGINGLVMVFGYVQFLMFRYTRNLHTRGIMDTLGSRLDQFFLNPVCPAILTRAYTTVRAYLRSSIPVQPPVRH